MLTPLLVAAVLALVFCPLLLACKAVTRFPRTVPFAAGVLASWHLLFVGLPAQLIVSAIAEGVLALVNDPANDHDVTNVFGLVWLGVAAGYVLCTLTLLLRYRRECQEAPPPKRPSYLLYRDD
jgi:hypothetical protein